MPLLAQCTAPAPGPEPPTVGAPSITVERRSECTQPVTLFSFPNQCLFHFLLQVCVFTFVTLRMIQIIHGQGKEMRTLMKK